MMPPKRKALACASDKEEDIAVAEKEQRRAKAVVLLDEPSSSTLRANAPKYEIFINHRGPDGKLSFVAHLADALRGKYYTPFVDKDDIRKGEKCSEEMQAALEGASVQVAVFTPGYAESKYCLNELMNMLQCCNSDPENVKLLPVFFNVKPGDLRRFDDGPFQVAFQVHESRALAHENEQQRKDEQERIKRWKKALFEAAGIDGFELSSMAGDENQLKHKIVDQVESILGLRILRKQPIRHPSIGLITPFIQIEEEFEKMRDTVTILGIWGMGGIGKTTLAKELYNRYTEKYEFYTFVEIGGAKTMGDLQKQVLHDLLGRKDENIHEKYNSWFHELAGRRVLLVIDNVSNEANFSELVPNLKSLGLGSRIIVTSRDQHVLRLIVRGSNSFYLHQMQELNDDASHELFSFHAFETRIYSRERHFLTKRIVDCCGGLPLALEIIGKHLYGKEKGVWEEVAESMETRFEVLDVLSISYRGLSKSEKTMFLDVSCQMIGMLEEDAIDIWKSCALGNSCRPPRCWTSRCVRDSLCMLKDKALVKVDSEMRLTMHDLLQEMGRMFASKDSIDIELRNLEDHSHLWNVEDARLVLEAGKGTENIRGISLVAGFGDTIYVDASKFQKMIAIHLLQLDHACIEGDFSKWSSNIRWLRWTYSSLTKVPSKLRFPFLIHLDLSYSENLTQLWSEDDTQVPRFLKVLNLSGCASLEEIPENIKFLTKLKRLNLRFCERLISLPSALGHLIELEEIDLDNCWALKNLPSDIVNLSSLKILTMEGCSRILTLPYDFGKLKALVKFSSRHCRGLSWLPDSFSELSLLEELSLGCCRGLLELPKSVKGHVNLKVFMLNYMTLMELPTDFGDLDHLVELYMEFCCYLESLPESFGRLKCLKVLNLSSCSNLHKLCSNFGQLSSLMNLDLSHCPITTDGFPLSFGGLCCLSTFQMCNSHLTRLPENFYSLTALVHLNLKGSRNLVEIGSLPAMLEVLDLSNCPSLVIVRGLEHMQALEEIHFFGCCKLKYIYDSIIFNPKLKRCFLDESNIVYLKYKKNWSEEVPSSQVVFIEYFDSYPDFLSSKDEEQGDRYIKRDGRNDPYSKPEEDEEQGEPYSEYGHFKYCPRRWPFKRCMEMTISNEKRVDAVIIILRITGLWGIDIYSFQARILRSNAEVYSSLIFSQPRDGSNYFNDLVHQCYVMIFTLRRSHPLVGQLQHGDKLCIYTDLFGSNCQGEGKIFVAYAAEYDLDTSESIFTDLSSICNIFSQNLKPIDTRLHDIRSLEPRTRSIGD